MIAVQNEREWARLCTTVLDDAALATDDRFSTNSRRVAHRPELDGALAVACAAHPVDALIARLEVAGIAWGRLTELEEDA